MSELKLSSKRIRLARRQKAASSAATAVTLSQQLLARYLARWHPWQRLGLILKIASPASVNNAFYRQTRLTVAPRLSLTLLNLPLAQTEAAAPAERPDQTPTPSPAWQLQRRAHPARELQLVTRRTKEQKTVATKTMVAQAVQELVTRSQQRGQRLHLVNEPGARRPEPVVAPAVALAADITSRRPPLPPPPAPPVPRVVHRPSTVVTPALNREPAPERPSALEPFSVQAAAVRQQQAEPPTIDLNRLTDQVVQALDRRVLAYRERTGRI